MAQLRVDSFDTATSLIHRSFDLGITHFDLANYGPFPRLKSDSITEEKVTIGRLNDIAVRRGQTRAQMALSWVRGIWP